jgi:murein DD-endopeptidase MepM/ murein hydrolase activator NlpD
VKIKLNDTFEMLYAHCSSIAVTNGQEVKKSQVIVFFGTTGNSTGDHLHFEVYQNGVGVNSLGFYKQ